MQNLRLQKNKACFKKQALSYSSLRQKLDARHEKRTCSPIFGQITNSAHTIYVFIIIRERFHNLPIIPINLI